MHQVVELLEQNIELNEERYLHMAETPAAVQLDWEDPAPEPATLHLYPDENAGDEEGDSSTLGFGIILASDCLYCDAAVKPLFDTATRWLAPDGVWVLAHIARWDNVEAALVAELGPMAHPACPTCAMSMSPLKISSPPPLWEAPLFRSSLFCACVGASHSTLWNTHNLLPQRADQS